MRATVMLIVSALLLAAPLRAEPLSGAGDPAFVAARTQWLAGDDMAALATLAALALEGNTAAQLLLATIEQRTDLHPEALAELPRAERVALLRAPEGRFGTSWVNFRAGDLPLAAALSTAGGGYGLATGAERRAALETLLAAGEGQAALGMVATMSNEGGWAPDEGWGLTVRFAAHPALAGNGLPMLEMLHGLFTNPDAGFGDPGQAAAVEAAIAEIGASPAERAVTSAAIRHRRTLEEGRLPEAQAAVGKSVLAAPFRTICAEICPKTTNACTFALLAGTWGVPGRLTLSPLEGAITTAEYRSSPRFQGDVLGSLGSNSRTPPEQRAMAREQVARLDQCAATALHGAE